MCIFSEEITLTSYHLISRTASVSSSISCQLCLSPSSRWNHLYSSSYLLHSVWAGHYHICCFDCVCSCRSSSLSLPQEEQHHRRHQLQQDCSKIGFVSSYWQPSQLYRFHSYRCSCILHNQFRSCCIDWFTASTLLDCCRCTPLLSSSLHFWNQSVTNWRCF